MNASPLLSEHTTSRQPSAIRVASIEFAARQDDTEAINVAIGNVSLPMHPRMQEALARAGTPQGAFGDGVVRYTPTVGTEACREAVRRIIRSTLSAENRSTADGLHVQITDGGSQAMELMILACCGPAGSEERPLLIIDAAYTNYLAFAARLGRKVVSVRRYLTDDGHFPLPDQATLNQVFADYQPGAVVIIPYDNPTGSLYREDDLKRLATLCVEHNCWFVSDEAYRELHYTDDEAPSVWSLSNADVDGIEGRRIGIETASKVWNACGLRIGALVTDNAELHTQCVAENTASLCPSAVGQAVFGALAQESESQLRAWFQSQRDYYRVLVQRFYEDMKEALPKARVSRPEASIYSVIDVAPLVDESFSSLAFVMWCAREGRIETEGGPKTLLTAPMEGFYERDTNPENTGRTQFRFAFVESPEVMKEIPDLFAKLLHQYLREQT
jgi:aspartate aminotransferase